MSADFTKVFRDSLNAKHKALMTSLQQFLDGSIVNNKEYQRRSAQASLERAKELSQFLSEEHCPTWLRTAVSSLSLFLSQPDNQESVNAISSFLTKYYSAAQSHKWNFEDARVVFDAEEEFRVSRDENGIPKLFEEIIAFLRQIASSGEIDSIRLQKELQDIIDLLEESRSGTYAQTRSTWLFCRVWFKNTLWEFGKSIPGLGPVVKGLHTTIEKGDKAFKRVDEQISEKMYAFGSANLRLTNQQDQLRLPDRSSVIAEDQDS